MLNQGTLRLSLTFNPLHARQKAASGELPTDSYSFGFTVRDPRQRPFRYHPG